MQQQSSNQSPIAAPSVQSGPAVPEGLLPRPLSPEELTRWLFGHRDFIEKIAAALNYMNERRNSLLQYVPRFLPSIGEDDLAFRAIQLDMPRQAAEWLCYQKIFKRTKSGFVVAQEADMNRAMWSYWGELQRVERETQLGVPEEEIMPAGVPQDLFDGIVGYPEVKKAMAMLLGARRPIPALLVGEPASGKTLFLEALNRLPGAIYRSADGMTAAGIRQVVINTHPTIIVLDEIDKCADVHSLAPLNELLESQTVSVMKYGESVRTETHTRVFAACNYIERIPKEIVSKFHVLRLKRYTPEEALHVSLTYLKKLGASEDIAQIIAHGVASRSRDIRDVRRAWDVCKTAQDAKWWVSQLGAEQKV